MCKISDNLAVLISDFILAKPTRYGVPPNGFSVGGLLERLPGLEEAIRDSLEFCLNRHSGLAMGLPGIRDLHSAIVATRITAELMCHHLADSISDGTNAQFVDDCYRGPTICTVGLPARPVDEHSARLALAWLAQNGLLSPYTCATVVDDLRRNSFPDYVVDPIVDRLRCVIATQLSDHNRTIGGLAKAMAGNENDLEFLAQAHMSGRCQMRVHVLERASRLLDPAPAETGPAESAPAPAESVPAPAPAEPAPVSGWLSALVLRAFGCAAHP